MPTNNLTLERTGRVTGSRIAGVLNLSPYRSRDDVMREMVREHHWADPEFDGNFATDYGQDHEMDGIAEYEMRNGVTLACTGKKQLTVLSKDNQFAVTPDGLLTNTDDRSAPPVGAVEIKCPFRATYTHWTQRRDYEQQMRLTAEVLDVPWVDFGVWRYEGMTISRMERGVGVDAEGKPFDLDWLRSVDPLRGTSIADEVEKFLTQYHLVVESEELSAPFLENIKDRRTDDEWLEAEATLLELMSEEDRLTQEVTLAKQKLATLAGSKSTKGPGLHVIYRKPSAGGAGTISYKNALEALVPEDKRTPQILDKFRGRPSSGGGRGTHAFKRLFEEKNEES